MEVNSTEGDAEVVGCPPAGRAGGLLVVGKGDGDEGGVGGTGCGVGGIGEIGGFWALLISNNS